MCHTFLTQVRSALGQVDGIVEEQIQRHGHSFW